MTTDFGAGKEAFPASGRPLPQAPTPEETREADPPKPAREVTTDPAIAPAPVSAPPSKRSPGASACEPYREIIEVALARGRNAMAIWQDLVSQCGFIAAYTSVKRFVRRLHTHFRYKKNPFRAHNFLIRPLCNFHVLPPMLDQSLALLDQF